MSIKVEIKVDPPDYLAGLQGKLANLADLNGRLAVRVRQMVQDNFRSREAEPNKNNWRKTGYFLTLYNNTKIGAVDKNHAEVVIADPDRSLARKLSANPGPITPKRGKYLAIPARAEAYGKTPRSFRDLRFIPFRSGAAALVQTDQQLVKFGRKRKDGSRKVTPGAVLGGGVFFWLVKSANPPPDPRALPPIDQVAEAIREEGQFYVEELKNG